MLRRRFVSDHEPKKLAERTSTTSFEQFLVGVMLLFRLLSRANGMHRFQPMFSCEHVARMFPLFESHENNKFLICYLDSQRLSFGFASDKIQVEITYPIAVLHLFMFVPWKEYSRLNRFKNEMIQRINVQVNHYRSS